MLITFVAVISFIGGMVVGAKNARGTKAITETVTQQVKDKLNK